ncbi:MAG: zinc-binding dehydrogenase [Rhodobacteraceae bacterium]|nr:zinc-binding dehydrogenase [Paracoccaceae bacterium]
MRRRGYRPHAAALGKEERAHGGPDILDWGRYGSFDPDLTKHFQKSVAVRVSDIYAYFTHRPAAFNADMSRVFTLLERKVLRPQITLLPLSAAAEAHRRLEAGETTGKLVLSIDP